MKSKEFNLLTLFLKSIFLFLVSSQLKLLFLYSFLLSFFFSYFFETFKPQKHRYKKIFSIFVNDISTKTYIK